MRSTASSCRRMFLYLLFSALALPAFATLGGDLTSVQTNQAHMKASIRITQPGNYTVHEMKSGETNVRQYVSPAGKVFGVAWDGPLRPNMQELLGSYYEQFLKATQNRRRGHNAPITVQEPGLVLQMSGHQRHFVGRAYVPQMLPQGVDTTEIK